MNYLKEALKRGIIGILIGVFINKIIFSIIDFDVNINGGVIAKIIVNQSVISLMLGFLIGKR